jgi:hypothetical protein
MVAAPKLSISATVAIALFFMFLTSTRDKENGAAELHALARFR